MFSGIVQECGIVDTVKFVNSLLEITVLSNKVINSLKIGDSVAINGCCQTVVEKNNKFFKVQATQETLSKTNFLKLSKGSKINLEPSIKLNDKLDGHLVLGHIDSTGEVLDTLSCDGNKIVKISFLLKLNKFLAPKGSITVNGVSLTIQDVKNDTFTFTLIPYTSCNTNLGLIKRGDLVNLEVDVIARYLVNYLESSNQKREVRGTR